MPEYQSDYSLELSGQSPHRPGGENRNSGDNSLAPPSGMQPDGKITAMEEFEMMHKALFNILPDSVLLVENTTGVILDANEAAVKAYGYPSEKWRQLKIGDIIAEPEQKTSAETKTLLGTDIGYHRTNSGRIIPVETTTNHFKFHDREVYYFVIRDIGDRLETERRYADLEARLRQAHKMEAIGTLAGGIAHDFNNILSSVIGYTELAMDEAANGSNQHQNLEEVIQAGMRAKELVYQILAFSRRSEQQMQPIQVNTIVKEAAKMLRSTIPATIELEVETIAENSTILGDPVRIYQVLMNLCTNATNAMVEKGGILTIALEAVKHIEGKDSSSPELSRGPYLKLSVSDTGTGMTVEDMEGLCDPKATLHTKDNGAGLGLVVVHGIVKSHKGHIEVKSQPNRGTTIEVFFPMVQQAPVQTRLTPTAELPGGPEHILLVDDELQIIKMQKQILERMGYTVSTQTDSLEALAAFETNPTEFDIVITDMTMPHITGLAMAAHMKEIRPGLPIILCTGFSEQINDTKAKEAGIDKMLMKPVGKEELAETLRILLE